MQSVIRSIFVLFFLGFFTVASAQLPPEILVDKHLIEAEQLHAAKDFVEAFKVMEKILALQKEHSLTLSDEFHFKYALVALSADSIKIARESVHKYLSATGKEGEFYKEALALLLKVEADVIISPGKTCSGKPEGSKCWQELANHPECYVWNDYFIEKKIAIWSGKCSGNMPAGKGTLTWYFISKDKDGKQTQRKRWEFTGSFLKGKWHGHRVGYEYTWNEDRQEPELYSVLENIYVNGKRHGHEVSDEKYRKIVVERIYLDGKLQDGWAYFWGIFYRNPDWSVKREGPDENGNGHIIYRASDGSVWGGPYVNYTRHGQWVQRAMSLNGKIWKESEGSYVDGKRHGHWIARNSHGEVSEGPFVEDKKHGHWIARNSHGEVSEGSYVDGKKHGHWVTRYPNGYKTKGEYIYSRAEGTWLQYNKYDDECWSRIYRQGEGVEEKKINKKMCR